GAAKRKRSAYSHGPNGIQPVRILDNRQLGMLLYQLHHPARVLYFARVTDPQTDCLYFFGEALRSTKGAEHVQDETGRVLAWLEVLLVADVVEQCRECDNAER